MIWVHVTSPLGVEAEFSLDSPTVAVDLALRSERAGLRWRAETRDDGAAEPLSLTQLRALATASGDRERHVLAAIELQHELQASVQLN